MQAPLCYSYCLSCKSELQAELARDAIAFDLTAKARIDTKGCVQLTCIASIARRQQLEVVYPKADFAIGPKVFQRQIADSASGCELRVSIICKIVIDCRGAEIADQAFFIRQDFGFGQGRTQEANAAKVVVEGK